MGTCLFLPTSKVWYVYMYLCSCIEPHADELNIHAEVVYISQTSLWQRLSVQFPCHKVIKKKKTKKDWGMIVEPKCLYSHPSCGSRAHWPCLVGLYTHAMTYLWAVGQGIEISICVHGQVVVVNIVLPLYLGAFVFLSSGVNRCWVSLYFNYITTVYWWL